MLHECGCSQILINHGHDSSSIAVELFILRGFQSGMMIFKFCVGAGWFSLSAAFRYSGFLVSKISYDILHLLQKFLERSNNIVMLRFKTE